MRKLFLFGLLILLMACREDVPSVVETAVPPTSISATAVSIIVPTNLPAPAIEERVVENTAVPPTATPVDPSNIDTIIAQVELLSARFEATYPYQTGWFYSREASYEWQQPNVTQATYRGLAENWLIETWTKLDTTGMIDQQVLLVYDTEGGNWERTAILDNTTVRVLPEKTIDGRIRTFDESWPFQTPSQFLLTILRDMQTPSLDEHTLTAWEENGRYHIQIDTLYQTAIPAENNTTGQLLNGGKIHFVLDINSGELVQQQNWIVNGAGEETLLEEINWLETAVVPELPPLAAQTLIDAQALLAQSGD